MRASDFELTFFFFYIHLGYCVISPLTQPQVANQQKKQKKNTLNTQSLYFISAIFSYFLTYVWLWAIIVYLDPFNAKNNITFFRLSPLCFLQSVEPLCICYLLPQSLSLSLSLSLSIKVSQFFGSILSSLNKPMEKIYIFASNWISCLVSSAQK